MKKRKERGEPRRNKPAGSSREENVMTEEGRNWAAGPDAKSGDRKNALSTVQSQVPVSRDLPPGFDSSPQNRKKRIDLPRQTGFRILLPLPTSRWGCVSPKVGRTAEKGVHDREDASCI